MSIRALDTNGDWTFGNGLLDYKVQQKEIEQDLTTKILSWKNDCFFDLDAGVDWTNYLGNYQTENEIKKSIVNIVNKTTGVVSLNSYEAFLNENRNLRILLNITTIYSTTNLNFEL